MFLKQQYDVNMNSSARTEEQTGEIKDVGMVGCIMHHNIGCEPLTA